MKKQHNHNWEEHKTTYGKPPTSKDAPIILSRLCRECGECQFYHGGEKRWVVSGNINKPFDKVEK